MSPHDDGGSSPNEEGDNSSSSCRETLFEESVIEGSSPCVNGTVGERDLGEELACARAHAAGGASPAVRPISAPPAPQTRVCPAELAVSGVRAHAVGVVVRLRDV